MGMFDTVLVHKSLIDPLLKKEWSSYIEQEEENYYNFQSKSLEKFLWTYFIEADKLIYVTKHSYLEEIVEPKEIKKIKENFTSDIYFYDGFTTDSEEVWLEFKATIIRGQLEEITLQKSKCTSVETIKEKSKIANKWREEYEGLWQMKVFRFLQNLEWKVVKIYTILFGKKYCKFKNWLRKQADKRAGPFPNIYE